MQQSEAAATKVPERRRRRGLGLIAGLLVGSMLIFQSTHATWSATTQNDANTFGVGTISITDNDAGTTMFSVPALAPGATGTVCMGVEYTGSLSPTAIKLYTANPK